LFIVFISRTMHCISCCKCAISFLLIVLIILRWPKRKSWTIKSTFVLVYIFHGDSHYESRKLELRLPVAPSLCYYVCYGATTSNKVASAWWPVRYYLIGSTNETLI
jgi:hypothetical protein